MLVVIQNFILCQAVEDFSSSLRKRIKIICLVYSVFANYLFQIKEIKSVQTPQKKKTSSGY